MQAAFFGCRVGIYAYAGTGCLKQRTRACVPHTPYTLVLKFVPSSGGVCGAATNAVSGDAGYGLLLCCVLQAIFAFVQFPLVVR